MFHFPCWLNVGKEKVQLFLKNCFDCSRGMSLFSFAECKKLRLFYFWRQPMGRRCGKAQARADSTPGPLYCPSRRQGSRPVTALRLVCCFILVVTSGLSVCGPLVLQWGGCMASALWGEDQTSWWPNVLPWVPFSAAEMQVSFTVSVTWNVSSLGASVCLRRGR